MQCETMIKEGSFMTLGPRSMKQCTRDAFARCGNLDWDGESHFGSQLICRPCLEVFHRQQPNAVYKMTDLETGLSIIVKGKEHENV